MSKVIFSSRDLAARWAVSEKTLERWRMLRTGPDYIKLGGLVRYRLEDISQYETRFMRRRTSAEVA
ncbi:MAG: DNA-binding protein [Bacteroidetes bacterium]|nr:DNA-binding protein [Bacteroidota bacterium]